MTASVAAMIGGESITMNLYCERSSQMAAANLCEASRSAGLGGMGPVGMAARLVTAGCGIVIKSRLETPARYELSPALLPSARLRARLTPGLRRSASINRV